MNASLLAILRCPETRQTLREADDATIAEINARIRAKSLRNRAGREVIGPIDAGLIREDGIYLYPERRGIPVMLVDEAIPLGGGTSST
jgi:uncharacterized protein YbaR (Trm112 family)